MRLDKIPATIVTGFLGSGKTTLLSNVIRQANGKRIAVIVNEFGELDIDAELLRSCAAGCEEADTTRAAAADTDAGGIHELANGCICCTVEEEFLPVMKRLVQRRANIDHVLIETSGLALPKPLVQAFNWPEIRPFFTVDCVLAVVDGVALAAGRPAHDPQRIQAQRIGDAGIDHDRSLRELLEDQLVSADLVIMNKTDSMCESQIRQVRGRLEPYLKNGVRVVEAANGIIDRLLITGLQHATEESIESVSTHHDRQHEHGREHDHAHEHFDSVCIEFGEVDGEPVARAVKQLIREYMIYRVKGFLALPGKPMRQILQGVGERMHCYFDRPWRPDEQRRSRLVFIGRGLNLADIEAALPIRHEPAG